MYGIPVLALMDQFGLAEILSGNPDQSMLMKNARDMATCAVALFGGNMLSNIVGIDVF